MITKEAQLASVLERYPVLAEFNEAGIQAHSQAENYSSDRLLQDWNDRYDEYSLVPFQDNAPIGVLGSLDKLNQASIVVVKDIDEVLRDTAGGLLDAVGIEYDRKTTLGYDEPFGVEMGVMSDIVSGLLVSGRIKPMQGMDIMRSDMEHVAQDPRVYIVAVTSALQGCEKATIDFLNENYPDIFDGISFPGNFDGNGKFTKADSIKYIVNKINIYQRQASITSVEFIDDSPHHIADVRTLIKQYRSVSLNDVTPIHAMNNGPFNCPKTGETFAMNYVENPVIGISAIRKNVDKRLGAVV